MPLPPAAVISSAVSSAVPGSAPGVLRVRAVTYTVAPASPSPMAVPLPSPRLAPVTRATLPASGLAVSVILLPFGTSAVGVSRCCRSCGRPFQRELIDGIGDLGAAFDRNVGVDLEFRDSSEPLLKEDLDLQAGQTRSWAGVWAGAEGEVQAFGPGEVDLGGAVEDRVVEVVERGRDGHHVALLHGDAA